MIEVSYSVFDTAQTWDHQGTYEEACLIAEPDDEIWVTAFGEPLFSLPDHFNRHVTMEDGEELRSAVVKRCEIIDLSEFGVTPEPYPLGEHAPLLTIDHQTSTLTWEGAGPSCSWEWHDLGEIS